jgi:hypothetical protein
MATGRVMADSVIRLPSRFRPGGRVALEGGTPPRPAPAWLGREKLSVIAIAAFTSASVSLLTSWIGGEGVSRSREESAAVEVSAPLSAAAPTPAELSPPHETSASYAPLGPSPADPSPAGEPAAQEPPPPLKSQDRPLMLVTLAMPQMAAPESPLPRDTQPQPSSPVVLKARSTPARPVPVATAGLTPVRRTPVSSRAVEERSTKSARGGLVRTTALSAEAAGLVVITEPAGARVTINGLGWGTTPLTIPNPPPGSKRIRVSKSGYRSVERVLGTDGAGAGATLRIALQEAVEGGTR